MQETINSLRTYYNSGQTLNYNFRIQNLKKLKIVIEEYEPKIIDALKLDLNKSSFESYLTEIGMVKSELTFMIKNLKKLMKDKKVKTPMANFGSKSLISYHPYGVCLILSPWNYPFMLTIQPLIGAIVAGNTALIKPSEFSVNTSNVIYEMISKNFNKEYISVILGDHTISSSLLDYKFDLIFFTGSINVGKIVMEKASKNLTPVILELGGKSPAIVTKSADLKAAAKRIIFGKILNAGQTCVAPDYVYIDESVKDEFIKHLLSYINEFLPNGLSEVNYPKIINSRQYNRILSLIDSEKVIYGNNFDGEKISITILDNVSYEDKVMQEEIFGPVLPILTYKEETEAISKLKTLEHPLALYLFTDNKKTEKLFIDNLNFGGGCVNDTIMHLVSPYMGFGGVGSSGMGSYHGSESFYSFSHKRSILKHSKIFDFNVRYHPYNEKKDKFVRKLLK